MDPALVRAVEGRSEIKLAVRSRCSLVAILLCLCVLFLADEVHAQRIKDLARVQGIRHQQLHGIGLVTGLAGTGDGNRNRVTIDLYREVLKNLRLDVNVEDLRSKNLALVMVTATVASSTKIGSGFEITVSSIGDAKSLAGGFLLDTPLYGPGRLTEEDLTYAIGHGPIEASTEIATVGRGTAILEEDISLDFHHKGTFTIILNNPDFSSASRVATAINDFPYLRALLSMPSGRPSVILAHAVDSGSVEVQIPKEFHASDKVVGFISRIMGDVFVPRVDREARVVIDRESGIVAINGNVRVSPVVIQIDGISIHIPPPPDPADPNPPTAQSSHPPLIQVMAELEENGIAPGKIAAIVRSINDAGALIGKLIEK